MGISGAPTPAFRRAMIFIDASNFLAGFDDFQRQRDKKFHINCSGLIRILLHKACQRQALIRCELIKASYYGSESLPDSIKYLKERTISSGYIRSLIEDFKANHVRIILKQRIRGKEKGVDIALAVDMLSMAYSNAYDYAIIVSGDADYINAIDEIKRYGKVVHAASFKSRFNEELMTHIDGITYLDDETHHFLDATDKDSTTQ